MMYPTESRLQPTGKFSGSVVPALMYGNGTGRSSTLRKVKSNQLCGDKQTDLCVLIDAGKSDAEVAQTLGKLNQVVTHFEFDKVVFAYVRSDEDPLVAESFDGNAAVIFKSKRKRYTAISMGSVEEINEAVTNVLGGGGSWNKLSNDKLKFGKHSATEEL